MNVQILDHGRITANSNFVPLLRAAGLDSFHSLMDYPGGRVFRDFPGRQTVRLELRNEVGVPQPVFLKRYESHYLSRWQRLLRLLRWPGAGDEALCEWEMIREIARCGIRTATPIALGQSATHGAPMRSCLLTAEIPNAVDGQHFASQLEWRERREFLGQVAIISRRLHQAQFVHKDFYLGHVLVSQASLQPELYLIDLQRVARPRCLRTRWFAKDLGALAYSSTNAGATRSDLLRGYLAYAGKTRLQEIDKPIVKAVLRRMARLKSRRPKYDGPV